MQDISDAFTYLIDRIVAEDLELVVSIAAIMAALILVWLILRGPRLWYWKINEKTGALRKMDSRLKNVEEHIAQTELKSPIKQRDAETTSASDKFEAVTFPNQESPNSGVKKAKKFEIVGDLGDKADEDSMETIIGKSGRVYRRDELEAQIKD